MNPLERVATWSDAILPGADTEVAALSRSSQFDLMAFIERQKITVRRRRNWNGGEIFELEYCPINKDHTRSAVITRGSNGALGFRCLHTSCSLIDWPALRERLEPPQVRNGRTSARNIETEKNNFCIDDIPSIWSFEAHLSWLVQDVIPEAAVTLLTGDSGVGKSTLALALAGAVAAGTRFLERDVVRRRVLYVDRENPLPVIKERIQRLGIQETPDLIYWGLWNDPGPDGPAAPGIIKFARRERPLIMFDSLIGFHDGKEQDASETRTHLQHYRRLAADGASVVVLHHTGKAESSKQYRGSSDIKASVDCAYLLERVGDATVGLESLRLTPFKSRLSLAETIRLQCVSGRFLVSNERTQTKREIIEKVIRDHPGYSESQLVEVARTSGISKHCAETLLSEGVQKDWLELDVGKRGRKTYRLKEVEVGNL